MGKTYNDLDELLQDNGVLYKYNTNLLREEAKKLKHYLEVELTRYYMSYVPKVYKRTLGLDKSVVAGADSKFAGNHAYIMVWFNDGAYAKSLFGGHTSGKATLIDKGWKVKKNVWFRNIPHFGYQRVSHFIDKAIKEYKSELKQRGLGRRIIVTRNDDKKR